ncbi:MAG: glycosyltransferase family 1 protein [Gammaproteobacteria bacterium]|nr:glycosyltransferase family 1 protein [Gammaproteobacteria bacterium]
MRIALVTDAWQPQVNGVVRTLQTTLGHLAAMGHMVQAITPLDFNPIACPTYPSIRLALRPGRGVAKRLAAFQPDAIHIATEGPLGHAARRYCLRQRRPFTTSFHTQFPEYIRLRVPIPLRWTYAYLRWFHGAAVRTLVPTPTQRDHLLARGFQNLRVWSRGVDLALFKPADPVDYKIEYALRSPVAIYMGRVAVEKNIEAFLDLANRHAKVVIGEGPDLARLRTKYPHALCLGPRYGSDLAQHLAGGDVFVFPSRTDTFGLVLLEAMACGLPVAAFPVQGPVDVVAHGETGFLDEDLGRACDRALGLSRDACRAVASRYSWRSCSADFVAYLAPREAPVAMARADLKAAYDPPPARPQA